MAEAEDELKARERSAALALQAYQERRRLRRGEDTFWGSADILEHADELVSKAEHERRRCEIMDDAAQIGMSADLAEMLYDVSREEGLDPDFALELVRSGLGVAPPVEGVTNAVQTPTTDKYMPEWLGAPVGADELLRERTMRMSFRRLRGLLEQHQDPADALRAFALEPDVEHVGY